MKENGNRFRFVIILKCDWEFREGVNGSWGNIGRGRLPGNPDVGGGLDSGNDQPVNIPNDALIDPVTTIKRQTDIERELNSDENNGANKRAKNITDKDRQVLAQSLGLSDNETKNLGKYIRNGQETKFFDKQGRLIRTAYSGSDISVVTDRDGNVIKKKTYAGVDDDSGPLDLIGFVGNIGKNLAKTLMKMAPDAGEWIAKKMAKEGAEELSKGSLPISKMELEKFIIHGFRDNRHADLGLPVDTMASKGYKLIEDNFSKLKVGDNTVIANINGVTKSFKVFIKDGKIMALNFYSGISKRTSNVKNTGTVINVGDIKW
jgi:hypothetical protein